MTSHTHRPSGSVTRPFTGPVNPMHPNPAAHGNVEFLDVCRCGAKRRTLVNGQHQESSGWIEPASREEG